MVHDQQILKIWGGKLCYSLAPSCLIHFLFFICLADLQLSNLRKHKKNHLKCQSDVHTSAHYHVGTEILWPCATPTTSVLLATHNNLIN